LAICEKHKALFFECRRQVVRGMKADESSLSHTCIKKFILEWHGEYRKSDCVDIRAQHIDRCDATRNRTEVALMAEQDLKTKAATLLDDNVLCKQVIQQSDYGSDFNNRMTKLFVPFVNVLT